MNIPKDPCPKCNGVGMGDFECPHCRGAGEVDWVQMVMGTRGHQITFSELYMYCKDKWAEEEMTKFEFPFEVDNENKIIKIAGDLYNV